MSNYFNLETNRWKSGRFWLDVGAICASEAASFACAYVILDGVSRLSSRILNPTSHKTAFVAIALFKVLNRSLAELFPNSTFFEALPGVNWTGLPYLSKWISGLNYLDSFQIFFTSEIVSCLTSGASFKVSKAVADFFGFAVENYCPSLLSVVKKENNDNSVKEIGILLKKMIQKIRQETSGEGLLVPKGKDVFKIMDQIDLNRVTEIAMKSNNPKVKRSYEVILRSMWSVDRLFLTEEKCPYEKTSDIILDIQKVLYTASEYKYERRSFLIFSNYQNVLIYDWLKDGVPTELDKSCAIYTMGCFYIRDHVRNKYTKSFSNRIVAALCPKCIVNPVMNEKKFIDCVPKEEMGKGLLSKIVNINNLKEMYRGDLDPKYGGFYRYLWGLMTDAIVF